MKKLLGHWSTQFQSNRFPLEYYNACLEGLRTAIDPLTLKFYLSLILHWKDGKVRNDPHGETELVGMRFSIAPAKPHTYAEEKHGAVFATPEFFQWAQLVKSRSSFRADDLDGFTQTFDLYNTASVVIPSFILHVLNPRIFPLFDQHVDRARRFFRADMTFTQTATLTRFDYVAYESFWAALIASVGMTKSTVGMTDLKQIDNALWAMGKAIKTQRENNEPNARPLMPAPERNPVRPRAGQVGQQVMNTGSPEFKRLVLSYLPAMTQREAMQRAARELNVALTSSYLQYPGSHIDRWRKQGH